MRVAVIGLGLMGGTIAGHLLDLGHIVTGYDPEPDRRSELNERGGVAADSVRDAIGHADVAVLSLPNSTIMLEIVPDIAESGSEDLIVVDTTTGAPADSVRAGELLAAAGIDYTDATISGNAAQTAEKDIIFMLGATPEVARTMSWFSATNGSQRVPRRPHRSWGAHQTGRQPHLVDQPSRRRRGTRRCREGRPRSFTRS